MHADEHEVPTLPKCKLTDSVFIDLASGADFKNFYEFIDPKNTYYLIDDSLYVNEILKQKSEELKLTNVLPLRKDVLSLQRSDFNGKSIEIIRAKNIFKYVNRYLFVFDEHLQWLCEGGIFIFAEQSGSSQANQTFANSFIISKFKQLINEGWIFNCIFGNENSPLDLNSVIFTKQLSNDKEFEMKKLHDFYSRLKERYGVLTTEFDPNSPT